MPVWNANTVRVEAPRLRPAHDYPGAARAGVRRWFFGPALRLLSAEEWRAGLILCEAALDGMRLPGDWALLARELGLKSQHGLHKALVNLYQDGAIEVDLVHECGETLAGDPPNLCPRCQGVTSLGTALTVRPGRGPMGRDLLEIAMASPSAPKKAEAEKTGPGKAGPEKAPSAPRSFTDRVQYLAEKSGIPKTAQNGDFWKRWQQMGWRGMYKRLAGTPWEAEREAAILRALDTFYAAYFNFDTPQAFAANIVYALQGSLKGRKPDARPQLIYAAQGAARPAPSRPGNTAAEDIFKEMKSDASPTAKRWF